MKAMLNVSSLLSNTLVALLCVIAAIGIVILIQSLIYERNDEHRRNEREKRDIERHERRMRV